MGGSFFYLIIFHVITTDYTCDFYPVTSFFSQTSLKQKKRIIK